jgi:hypothetical protein
MANTSNPSPTAQSNYSTELELANAHVGLAYMAIGKMLKELLLELVKLGHVGLSTCQNTLLEDHLRNPSISMTGKKYRYFP